MDLWSMFTLASVKAMGEGEGGPGASNVEGEGGKGEKEARDGGGSGRPKRTPVDQHPMNTLAL